MDKKILIIGAGVAVLALAMSGKGSSTGTASVTATITSDKTSCVGACTVSGKVTYTNSGDAASTFTPSITVNGTKRSLSTTAITLQSGISQSFDYSIPITATTEICPVIPA